MTQAQPGTETDPFRNDLRNGETLADAFHVDDTVVGVTDRRLLVRRDGATRAVDLTNVRSVRQRTTDEPRRLRQAVQWTVVGVVLVGGWLFAPLDALVQPVEPPQGTGFDGLFETVNRLVDLLGYLDEAFLVGGVLAFLVAGGFVAMYLRRREAVLEITVAGMDPIRIPQPRDATAVDRLRGAVDAHAQSAEADDAPPDSRIED